MRCFSWYGPTFNGENKCEKFMVAPEIYLDLLGGLKWFPGILFGNLDGGNPPAPREDHPCGLVQACHAAAAIG